MRRSRAACRQLVNIAPLFLAALSTLASANGLTRLGAPLGSDDFIFSWETAPDGQHVAYTTGLITERTSNGLQYYPKSIFSSPVSGGPTYQLDRPQFANAYVWVDRPVFTPDAQSVIFAAEQEQPGLGGIYRATIDGANSQRLTDNTNGGWTIPDRFFVTNDGRYLIYQQDYSGDLRSVPVSGGAPVVLNDLLTPGQQLHGSFYMTPDSTRIHYEVITGNSAALFSVRPDGTERTPLAADVSANFSQATPDSKYITFVRGSYNFYDAKLYSVSVMGGPEHLLSPNLPYGFKAFTVGISPDSQQVAFYCDAANKDRYDLYFTSITGGQITRVNRPLLPDASIDFQMFSPDGKFLFYTYRSQTAGASGLFRASLADGSLTRMSQLMPAEEFVGRASFSDDGQWITYKAYNANGAYGVFMIPAAGGTPRQITPTRPVCTNLRLRHYPRWRLDRFPV